MALTQSQLQLLKTAAVADPTAAAYIGNGDDQALANWLNASQAGYLVWLPVLSTEQARAAIVKGISQLDNLTVGKRDSLLWFFSESVTPTDPKVTEAIDALCGTQNTIKTALHDSLRRAATRAEMLLATGPGTYASPGTLTFEGLFSAAQASTVRGG